VVEIAGFQLKTEEEVVPMAVESEYPETDGKPEEIDTHFAESHVPEEDEDEVASQIQHETHDDGNNEVL
jgi:hypothetical protein